MGGGGFFLVSVIILKVAFQHLENRSGLSFFCAWVLPSYACYDGSLGIPQGVGSRKGLTAVRDGESRGMRRRRVFGISS